MRRSIIILSILVLTLLSTLAFGATDDLTDVANRVTGHVPAIVKVLLAIVMAAGVYFAARGIFDFRRFGTNTMSQVSISNPFISVVIGVVLIYFTVFVGIGGTTLLGKNAKATDVENVQIRF